MSYSIVVKSEVIQKISLNSCCSNALLVAFILFSGIIQKNDDIFNIKVSSENAQVAKLFFLTAKKYLNKHCEVTIRRNNKLNKNYTYSVIIPDRGDNISILKKLNLIKKMDKEYVLTDIISNRLVQKKCCKKAFLQGFFLSCGSISNPEKMYHLEFDVKKFDHAVFVSQLLGQMVGDAKIVERKSHYVVYLKESEHIIEFLNIVGAHCALLDFENIRIMKELRNNVNRLVNCETANLEKTIEASIRHIENIEFIQKTIGIDNLPKNLREIANLRLKFKEASLKELGSMLSTPLGKSGVNHRLRKIDQMAEELRKGGKIYDK